MTQEDKELLLKDLCARLPYKVKVEVVPYVDPQILCSIDPIRKEFRLDFGKYRNIFATNGVDEEYSIIKPYLRPMSSMTEEEYEELLEKVQKDWSIDIDKFGDLYFDIGDACYPDIDLFVDIIDWLNKHYFDYRGLISKGLAIAVTEENNPYEIRG